MLLTQLFAFSFQGLPERTLKRAERSYGRFFTNNTAIFGGNAATTKAHCAKDTVDDMRSQDCHADYNSVYDFESEQQQWRVQKKIRSGTRILPQIQ
jgi:hypothetical protein